MSNKLIKELNESIQFKLKDIERYTKMINLVMAQDVKSIRKFIYDNDTYEKEMFFELLDFGDNKLFHKVYPNAGVGTNREYAVSLIHDQFVIDKKEEEKFGIDFGDGYPEDWSDEQYPDHINKSDPNEVRNMDSNDPWENGKDLSTHPDYKYL